MVINTNAIRDGIVSVVGERGFKVVERLALFAVGGLALWALLWQLYSSFSRVSSFSRLRRRADLV